MKILTIIYLLSTIFLASCNKANIKQDTGVLKGYIEQASPCGQPSNNAQDCKNKPISIDVKIINKANNTVIKQVSDKSGKFQLTLATGEYSVEVEKSKFFQRSSTSTKINKGDTSQVRLLVRMNFR